MKGSFCGQESPETLACRRIWPAEKSHLLSNESSDYGDYSVITSTELSVTWYQLQKCWEAPQVEFFTTINTYKRDKSVKIQIILNRTMTLTSLHICQGQVKTARCWQKMSHLDDRGLVWSTAWNFSFLAGLFPSNDRGVSKSRQVRNCSATLIMGKELNDNGR